MGLPLAFEYNLVVVGHAGLNFNVDFMVFSDHSKEMGNGIGIGWKYQSERESVCVCLYKCLCVFVCEGESVSL